MAPHRGWVGVDFDGTLATYQGWNGGRAGQPIPEMVERIKAWLEVGQEVRIVTARVGEQPEAGFADAQRAMIEAWCVEHIGTKLAVTAAKDFSMVALYDDRCVRVEPNTGRLMGPAHDEAPRHPEWRAGYVDAGADLRKKWAQTLKDSPEFLASQARVDEALEVLCRECDIDPIRLVDRLLGEHPTDAWAMPDDELGSHKLMSALAVVAPKLDAEGVG